MDEVLGCVSNPPVCRRGRLTGRSGVGVLGASGELVIAESSILIVGARGLAGFNDRLDSASGKGSMMIAS